jgi:hypothetical protein
MKTSIKIFGLVAVILIVLLAVVLIYVACSKKSADAVVGTSSGEDKKKKKQPGHEERKYLMLLGILVASVTYEAGLAPPGGMWQHNDDMGHVAGNSVMHDNGTARYLSFFYINSTSFVASIIVTILLLLEFLKKQVGSSPRRRSSSMWELIRPMNTMIVLADLLGLLVAYAVGPAGRGRPQDVFSSCWPTLLYM